MLPAVGVPGRERRREYLLLLLREADTGVSRPLVDTVRCLLLLLLAPLLAVGGVAGDARAWPSADSLADSLCVRLLIVRAGVCGEAPAALWLRETLNNSHSTRGRSCSPVIEGLCYMLGQIIDPTRGGPIALQSDRPSSNCHHQDVRLLYPQADNSEEARTRMQQINMSSWLTCDLNCHC